MPTPPPHTSRVSLQESELGPRSECCRLAPRATVILVRTCSEIPLPSPLFYSLSCQRAVAIWTSTLPLRWSRGSSPIHASSPWHSCRGRLWMSQSDQKSQNIDQLGSLAGAARLLQHNEGVLKHCSGRTEISQGGEGQRCC